MKGSDSRWTREVWGLVAATLPFLWFAGRLVRDSLSDVPEAYLVWVPLVAYFWIGWELRHRVLAKSPASVRDGLPTMAIVVAMGLILAVLLAGHEPGRFASWPLLLWPTWLGVVVWVLYGPTAVQHLRAPLLYLYLVWAPFYIWIIHQINPALEHSAYRAFDAAARYTPWLRPDSHYRGAYLILHAGRWLAVSITAACSGSDSILALLVVFPVTLLIFDMSRIQKMGLILVGCVLAYVGNLLRIAAIFGAAHAWGRYWAFAIIHPLLGPLLFTALVLGLLVYGGRRVHIRESLGELATVRVSEDRTWPLLGSAVVLATVLIGVVH